MAHLLDLLWDRVLGRIVSYLGSKSPVTIKVRWRGFGAHRRQLVLKPLLRPWGESFTLHDVHYADQVALDVSVWNHGPTDRFAVSVRDVDGIPKDWNENDQGYRVSMPAWEDSSETVREIPSGHERRIKLARVARQPRAFWFWTLEQGSLMAGNQFQIFASKEEGESVTITFTIDVSGLDRGSRSLARARVTIPAGSSELPDFRIERQ